MINIEILNLRDTLDKYKEQLGQLKGSEFAWALNRNIKKLDKETKIILSKQESTKDYNLFNVRRSEICESFSNKGFDGKALLRKTPEGRQEYDLDATNPIFIEAINKLKEEYKDVLEEQKNIFDEFKLFLQMENTDLSLIKIDLRFVPSEITVELMEVITPMINE